MKSVALYCRRSTWLRIQRSMVLACVACVGALTGEAALAQTNACAQVTNSVSRFPIQVDGGFTAGGEWSDVKPLAFHSDPAAGTLFQVCDQNDANANSFLYVAIAPGTSEEGLELYLLYDYPPRQDPNFSPGDTVAVIQFPVSLPDNPNIPAQLRGGKHPIGVIVKAGESNPERAIAAGGTNGFFDVFVDINLDGVADGRPADFGLEIDAAAGFGRSPRASFDHLIVELEVSLRIQPGFADPNGPLPGNGINPKTGLYDPNPVFWGGSFAGGGGGGGGGGTGALRSSALAPTIGGTVPGTAAIFRINPDGSTTANASFLPTPFKAVQDKKDIITKLKALLALPNLTKDDRKRIGEAIDAITKSLPFLVDETHAGSKKLFKDEGKAADALMKILKDNKSGLTASQRTSLRTCIDMLTSIDRNLAAVAIYEALAAFGDPERIAKANKQVHEGDQDAARGRPKEAIEEYGKAWGALSKKKEDGDD